MFDLYQEQIVERYKEPRHAGNLSNPDAVGDGSNPLCGDEVRLEIKKDQQGRVAEVSHITRACAVCTASADLLAEKVIHMSAQEIQKMGTPDITEMLGIPLSPTRLKCALLPLETLKQVLEQA